MSTDIDTPSRSTADLVTVAPIPTAPREMQPAPEPQTRDADADAMPDGEPLAPLFLAKEANDFRAIWDAVQIGFVDDPKQAVRKADELVAQVMRTLAETFSNERAKLESRVDQADNGSTENLRIALRRYRSFFQRLLSL
jgi:hypothetical protein